MSDVDSAAEREPGRQGRRRPADGTRTVLVLVHTLVYGQRLRELAMLLASDPRIRLTFTVAPHEFNEGARRFVRAAGWPTTPWEQAVRTRFDLALAAGSQGIERVSAPVVLVQHGASRIKLARGSDVSVEQGRRPVHGLGPEYLMRDGRVIPRAVVLAHEEERAQLARWCPQALPVAEVIGDPFLDRIVFSLPRRAEYRRALGLGEGEKLIVACSTWRPGTPLSRLEGLLTRFRGELTPPAYRTVLLVHPNAREGADGQRLNALLGEYRQHGIEALAVETDWRPFLVAADGIIGDHASTTLYGTVCRVPILLAGFQHTGVNPLSPAAELARVAPELAPASPLPEQLAAAAAGYRAEHHEVIAARLSSEPGRFERNFSRMLYRLLALDPPPHPPSAAPLPPPRSLPRLLIRSTSRFESRGLIPS